MYKSPFITFMLFISMLMHAQTDSLGFIKIVDSNPDSIKNNYISVGYLGINISDFTGLSYSLYNFEFTSLNFWDNKNKLIEVDFKKISKKTNFDKTTVFPLLASIKYSYKIGSKQYVKSRKYFYHLNRNYARDNYISSPTLFKRKYYMNLKLNYFQHVGTKSSFDNHNDFPPWKTNCFNRTMFLTIGLTRIKYMRTVYSKRGKTKSDIDSFISMHSLNVIVANYYFIKKKKEFYDTNKVYYTSHYPTSIKDIFPEFLGLDYKWSKLIYFNNNFGLEIYFDLLFYPFYENFYGEIALGSKVFIGF